MLSVPTRHAAPNGDRRAHRRGEPWRVRRSDPARAGADHARRQPVWSGADGRQRFVERPRSAAHSARHVNALPAPFVERAHALLGAEAAEFLQALDKAPVAALRVNTLKTSVEAFRARAPWPLEPVPWCPSGFVVADDERPGQHPYHAAGLYYLQEPTAMAVAESLGPAPGEWLLDLAAAPGGKSTHLLSLMRDTGLLVANEIEARRTAALAQNLERWGVRSAVVVNESPERLAGTWRATFDRVLLDAPCSGEGMFRKLEAARQAWSLEHVRGCSLRQARALDSAAQLVRPGGWLSYSTCTFAPEENEAV